MLRTYPWSSFSPGRVAAAKSSHRVSVCIPARDEAATIGPIVATIRSELMDRVPVVDELVVLDDGSSDTTADVAAAAGARVISAGAALPEHRSGPGKGQAMWRALAVTEGDVVAYCDADLNEFSPRFVLGLVGPLLVHDDLAFVKATYRRPLDGVPGEGGRVTQLLARPALGLLFPHLQAFDQPLAGEWAARRPLLESLSFEAGYGVEVGVLIDVAERCGLDAMAQADLGERRHRNRSLAELHVQATTILEVILGRAGVRPSSAPACPPLAQLKCSVTTSATQAKVSSVARSEPKRSTSDT